jgi:hypothetical protein
MIFRRGSERGFINGDLKVHRDAVSSIRPNPIIDLFRKVNGSVEEKGISFNPFLIELN